MEEIQLSSDREARILARRKRVQERLAALREGDKSGNKEDGKKEEVGKGVQQILDSRRRLLEMQYKTNSDLTSVRITGDDRENQHRMHEEQIRQELRAKLLAEAESSARQNASVAMRWADLFSIEVPQDLYAEIEKQRVACEKIIGSKDKLIVEIRSELKKKDDEYVRVLKRQAEDVDSLLQYMSTQYLDMQAAYREELDEVEAAFLQERSDLLDSNRGELHDLFDKRSRMESDFMERYLAQVESYQQQLEDLRVADAEDYHTLKIRLETDVQHLEQHLESMRATYQLNTEKLEYNYRVLVERDHENQATINQQKRKISRQRDVLCHLKSKYADSDQKYQEENMKLTDEYKRITEQFKDLQSKMRHFEAVDMAKFKEVWAMHEAEVTELVKQLLQADRIIHDQQLGWEWHAPDDEAFASPHSQEAAQTVPEGEEEDVGQRAEKELQERLHSARFAGALGLLCDEAGFLIDAKAHSMLEKLPRDEAGLVKAEAVLRALGVTDGPSFDALTDALNAASVVELRAEGVKASTIRRPADEEERALRGPVLVHPDEVVRRLKAFIDSERQAPSRVTAPGASKRPGISRRAAEREQEYWARMASVISEKGFRVWTALERSLDKYHGLLGEREGCLRGVESLQQQNAELRALLNSYLGSRINSELQVPPTQII